MNVNLQLKQGDFQVNVAAASVTDYRQQTCKKKAWKTEVWQDLAASLHASEVFTSPRLFALPECVCRMLQTKLRSPQTYLYERYQQQTLNSALTTVINSSSGSVEFDGASR